MNRCTICFSQGDNNYISELFLFENQIKYDIRDSYLHLFLTAEKEIDDRFPDISKYDTIEIEIYKNTNYFDKLKDLKCKGKSVLELVYKIKNDNWLYLFKMKLDSSRVTDYYLDK